MQMGVNLEDSWSRIQQRLRQEMGEAVFQSWLKPLHVEGLDNGTLKLAVPNRTVRDWVASNYADRILNLWLVEEPDLHGVDLVVQGGPRSGPGTGAANGHHGGPSGGAVNGHLNGHLNGHANGGGGGQAGGAGMGAGRAGGPSGPGMVGPGMVGPTMAGYWTTGDDVTEAAGAEIDAGVSAPLDPRYTFDNFVVGKPNELAYAAARRVAEAEPDAAPFNPLFLYGGVGLGKTHLMHAIGWAIRRANPRRRVLYLSAEKFMYQFVKALRSKSTWDFKELFRSVDVLMIDDIQFICGKDSTQEEFFHTFNALVDQKRLVVLSADKSPHDLDDIEERLRSRLQWGMVADIHPTTFELRLGILQTKAQTLALDVPQAVLEFIAQRITANVRELESALIRLDARAKMNGQEITVDLVQDTLADVLRANDRRVSIEEIQRRVAEHYNLRLADMSSQRRQRAIARPRQVAMYLAKQLTPASLPEIGRKFGGKDHTTVMHAVSRIEQLALSDPTIAEDLKLLRRALSA